MPRKKAYDRDQVLDKAMNLFWLQGYHTTSIRELEKEMGINQFSIYAEFENKQGVFVAALNKYMDLNKTVILKGLIESQGQLKDIKTFFQGFIKAVRSGQAPNGCLFTNTTVEIGKTVPEVQKQLRGFFNLLRDIYSDLLQKAQAKGELSAKSDIKKLSHYLVGVTEGLAVTAKVLRPEELNDFVDISLSFIKSN
ncbi:MAG: TetR/AcrR family transcriptional regulator [Cyclobacteriaceae bacterium]